MNTQTTKAPTNGNAAKTKTINFKRIEIARTPVDIAGRKGAAPLLMNKMSDGVIELLGGRATGEVVARPEKMSAKNTAEGHIHRINDKIVFPAGAFRGAIVDACRHQKIDKKLTMARVDGAFSVTGDEGDYCVIESDPYTVRADVVNTGKNAQGAPSVSFRPSFANWKTKIFLDYNPQSVTIEELLHLLDLAGFHVGIGSHRPEYGKFSVV